MADSQLTEHVWRDDGGVYWQGSYQEMDQGGVVKELVAALCEERRKNKRLREALEWIRDNRGYPLAFEAGKLADQVLREGGDGDG